jgi:outer membrane protein assembly factor BamB
MEADMPRRKLLRLGLAPFVCSMALASAFARPPDPIEGRWFGVVGFPTDRVEIAFEFKRNEKNELKAYLYQSVTNFYGLELPGVVTAQGDTYTHDEWALKLTLKDGKLEGSYFPLNAPIALERTDRLPAEAPVPELPKAPDPKWKAKLGAAIYAPVAVRDGAVYVGTSGGLFHAINLQDGGFVWTFAAGRPVFGGALATDDAVYFACDSGFLFKLDRKTGKEAWRYDLGDGRATRILPHQVVPNGGDFDFDVTSPSPVLLDGVLYVGSGDNGLHAVSATTGQRVWRFETTGRIRTDAVVDGTRVLVGSLDGFVYAVDRQTGKEVWKKNTYGPLTGSPGLVGGRLIVGNRNGLLAALDPATGQTAWRMLFWGSAVESSPVGGEGGRFYIGASDLRRVSAIDAKDGRVIWRTDVYGWAWPRPALTERFVYQSAIGAAPYQMRHLGSLTAIDRASGRIAWRWPMPDWPGAWTTGFAAPPVVQGGTLVVGGLDGTLYAFPAE